MSADGTVFREEFQRLMRALYDSLEREGELQRQLRRTKETLISVALRLQVAIKVAQEDELTISALQQQASDSKTKEILANRNAQDAAEMVSSLTFEINQLRRRLKIAEGDRQNATTPGGNNNANDAYQMSYGAADAEVDEMLGKNTGFPPTKFVDKKFVEQATPFERWKMNHFIFSPDTPAASEEHDRQVVQMLLEASAQEFSQDFKRNTQSRVAKAKKISPLNGTLRPLTHSSNSRTHLISTAEGGANVYETVGVSILDSMDIPPHSAVGGSRQGQEEKIYFLDKSAGAMWGSNAFKALQRTQSLGGTPGFGAGREDPLPRETTSSHQHRPGTSTNTSLGPRTSLSLTSPMKSTRQSAAAVSPDRRNVKGINSMIV